MGGIGVGFIFAAEDIASEVWLETPGVPFTQFWLILTVTRE